MADEIFLFRDETREAVPVNDSVVTTVNEAWNSIRKEVYDGRPFDYLLRGVEETLLLRKSGIEANKLDPRYDWQHDLALARFNHRYYLSWIEWNKETRQRFIAFWTDTSADNFKYVRELSLNGFKTIVLLHGAVALGSVNVLAQKFDHVPASTVLAAKLGLIFAVLGIISAGIGQLISFHALSSLFGRIQAKLASIPRWRKVRAFAKYSQKFQPMLQTATFLIYGSIFWFCAYSIILFVVLIT